jgi:hypothetical protein
MMTLARCTFLAATVLAFTAAAVAQMPAAPMTDHGVSVNGAPLASPPAMAEVMVGTAKITVHYNAPSLRGRVMIGGKDVPYDKVWRTGANPATSFVTTGDLKIGTLMVPAGSYTLYSLPEAPGTPWLLIVNKQTGQWGTVYSPDQDLGRTPMKAEKLPASQEMMSIGFEKTAGRSTELHIKWATWDEWVKIEAK